VETKRAAKSFQVGANLLCKYLQTSFVQLPIYFLRSAKIDRLQSHTFSQNNQKFLEALYKTMNLEYVNTEAENNKIPLISKHKCIEPIKLIVDSKPNWVCLNKLMSL
jgi:hypothetical protein